MEGYALIWAGPHHHII